MNIEGANVIIDDINEDLQTVLAAKKLDQSFVLQAHQKIEISIVRKRKLEENIVVLKNKT